MALSASPPGAEPLTTRQSHVLRLPGSHGGLSTLLSEQLPTTSVHREMMADVEPPANGAAKSNANMAHGGAGCDEKAKHPRDASCWRKRRPLVSPKKTWRAERPRSERSYVVGARDTWCGVIPSPCLTHLLGTEGSVVRTLRGAVGCNNRYLQLLQVTVIRLQLVYSLVYRLRYTSSVTHSFQHTLIPTSCRAEVCRPMPLPSFRSGVDLSGPPRFYLVRDDRGRVVGYVQGAGGQARRVTATRARHRRRQGLRRPVARV